jgi:chaperone BCS1
MMFRLFCMIFKQSEGEILHLKQAAEDDETVEQYGHEFARKIPEAEFSPAEIQSFLVEHRGSARVAVEKVQEWIDRARAERAKMARAGSFLAVSPLIV